MNIPDPSILRRMGGELMCFLESFRRKRLNGRRHLRADEGEILKEALPLLLQSFLKSGSRTDVSNNSSSAFSRPRHIKLNPGTGALAEYPGSFYWGRIGREIVLFLGSFRRRRLNGRRHLQAEAAHSRWKEEEELLLRLQSFLNSAF
ncbi:hypothetical protein CEXT_180861 [Caerostris extrusa]|uniref:Uncharacterized protein n=1 Tax=Caerostris extrusa TaxID=172846 RepID=A0AAV4X9X6_CAEEX|nr:hypothetical protein CEXT_180861 [Caerostris extrusa]